MAPGRRPSTVAKRSVTISGHSTSISLETPFWAMLAVIAKAEELSVAALVRHIDAERGANEPRHDNLSSAIRVFVMRWLAAKAGLPPDS